MQNYAVSDWYIVMTERGVLTLPQPNGAPDWPMGHFRDPQLTIPGGVLPAAQALEQIWRTRYTTDAIVVLA